MMRTMTILSFGMAAAATVAMAVAAPQSSAGSSARVGLGTAAPFAVLAGSAVTNTGPTVIDGNLGVSPGTSITGFGPGIVNGSMHSADAVARKAKKDLVTAYNDAAGRGPAVDETSKDLGGQRLVAGTYHAASKMALTGTVTLDAKGDPGAVFVFQAGSSLITAGSSRVSLVGGAQACNVYWQVGSSATLGTATRFVGTILALTSASLKTGATLQGRVLARNGAVTLDDNVINRPTCKSTSGPSPTGSPTPSPTGTSTGSPAPGPSFPGPTHGPSATNTPTSTSTSTTSGTPIPVGHPHTGVEPAARSPRPALYVGGVACLLAAAVTLGLGSRRRRGGRHG